MCVCFWTFLAFTDLSGAFHSQELILGVDRNFKDTFSGVIGALSFNGEHLIDLTTGRLSTNAVAMGVPSRSTVSPDELVVVLMPELLLPPISTTPSPPKPLPAALPPGASHGGILMPDIRLPDGGAAIFVPGAWLTFCFPSSHQTNPSFDPITLLLPYLYIGKCISH
ncbi:unnamed protein product [Protopolystoma xenopodis]|uniref:Laminin G domain-containing protein n=1 Tax=Protopolystoma xenopodis TaxID=117903 RepID=A0A448WK74_9PLAT|nr:unnamed protein product [Protopolystoma xenopodis]